MSKEHARILQRIGARHIINAETDAGKRVGHLVSGNYLDYIEIEGSHTVVKIHTPSHVVGYSIADAKVNERYGVTVVGIRHAGQIIPSPGGDAFLHGDDTVFLFASPASLTTVMPFFRTNPEPERAEDL